MDSFRAHSSPSLLPSGRRDELVMEGVATNVKLLLKLIEDCNQSRSADDRMPQRLAGMMTIIDDVKARVEKSQSKAARKAAELRRCNTDLRRTPIQNKQQQQAVEPAAVEENQKLRKELAASVAARKSLERMFSSIGKEKEIMAAELTKKAHELSQMEELVSELKEHNEMLMEKVKTCAAEHRGNRSGGGGGTADDVASLGSGGAEGLKEKNKELSEQLLKSLEGYRVLKRKLKEVQEENSKIRQKMDENGVQALKRLGRIREQLAGKGDQPSLEKELLMLESVFVNKAV